jgi:hypothetical protein
MSVKTPTDFAVCPWSLLLIPASGGNACQECLNNTRICCDALWMMYAQKKLKCTNYKQYTIIILLFKLNILSLHIGKLIMQCSLSSVALTVLCFHIVPFKSH